MLSGTEWTLYIEDLGVQVDFQTYDIITPAVPRIPTVKMLKLMVGSIEDLRNIIRKLQGRSTSLLIEKNRISHKFNGVTIQEIPSSNCIELKYSEIDRTLPVNLQEIPRHSRKLPEQKLDWSRLGF